MSLEDFNHQISINGKQTKEYTLWHNMRRRCLIGGSYQTRYPSYIGCAVHKEFEIFSSFIHWAVKQIGFGVDGYQLDKDILIPGNKVYGPDTCVFVPSIINAMLTHKKINTNGYPTGVSLKPNNKFIAQIKIDGVVKTLGRFDNPMDAFLVYKDAKETEIKRQANLHKDLIDPRVYKALISYEVCNR